jgi:hypothetical protein
MAKSKDETPTRRRSTSAAAPPQSDHRTRGSRSAARPAPKEAVVSLSKKKAAPPAKPRTAVSATRKATPAAKNRGNGNGHQKTAEPLRPSARPASKKVAEIAPPAERRAKPRASRAAAAPPRKDDRRAAPRATSDRRRRATPASKSETPATRATPASAAPALSFSQSPDPAAVSPVRTSSAAAIEAAWPAVGEQERVGAVKYGARPAPRGFDEERFLFPRNYEVNRVRVVARDPEWLFTYWDVNPRSFEAIRREMGERAMALSRLTLQVLDADGNATQVVLLPYGARSWYVRIDPSRMQYFIDLGITLPSGQFRSLARSNVVVVPRGGPSSQPAQRSVTFREAWAATGEIATGAVAETAFGTSAGAWTDPGSSIRSVADLAAGASDRLSAEMRDRQARESSIGESRAGASDLYRR